MRQCFLNWTVSFTLLVCPSALFAAATCTYAIDTKASVIEATGYKFTSKKGVTAKILGVTTDTKKAASVEALLKGRTVKVDLMSLDSGNTLRDNNIREQLLAAFQAEAVAEVEIKKIEAQRLVTSLKVNGVRKEVVFKTTESQEKDLLVKVASGSINGLDFMMKSGLAALAKRCQSLHQGDDGVSKTWSDFGLKVKIAIRKNCSPKNS